MQKRTEPIPFADSLRHSRKLKLAPDPDKVEKPREGTLIIHFSMYGTAEHKQQTVDNMLRNLSVKGYNFIQVLLDDVEIPLEDEYDSAK